AAPRAFRCGCVRPGPERHRAGPGAAAAGGGGHWPGRVPGPQHDRDQPGPRARPARRGGRAHRRRPVGWGDRPDPRSARRDRRTVRSGAGSRPRPAGRCHVHPARPEGRRPVAGAPRPGPGGPVAGGERGEHARPASGGLLGAAEEIVVVGAAEPVGIERLVQTLLDLDDVSTTGRRRVLTNRVRTSAAGPRAADSVREALARFADVADPVLVPDDRALCDRALLAGTTWRETGGRSAARTALTDLADDLRVAAGRPAAADEGRLARLWPR